MKQTLSLQNMFPQRNRASSFTGQLTKSIVIRTSNVMTFFSLFLSSSNGRDKSMAVFQYFFDFLVTCAQHSSIPEIKYQFKQFNIPSIRICHNFKEGISSARKVFRLLKWVDEAYRISITLKQNKPLSYKILSIVTCVFSALYYLMDNFLWIQTVLIKSKVLDKGKTTGVKDKKNWFSFYRVIFYILTLVYDLKLKDDQISKIISTVLDQKNIGTPFPYIGKTEPKINLVQSRRKVRFIRMELVLSLLRLAMLTQSLKLPGHQYFDPIMISVCGLVSSVMALFKAVFEKDIVVNIQSDDPNARKNYQE